MGESSVLLRKTETCWKSKSKYKLHDDPCVRQAKTLQAKTAIGTISEVLGKNLADLKDTWLHEPLNKKNLTNKTAGVSFS